MDVQMPEMDGPAAAREIRAREALSGRRRTPIIALTANVMSHQIATYRDAGMDDHVAKPISIATLLDAIERSVAASAPEPERRAV
jgi:CheY-like chemotaxis protein